MYANNHQKTGNIIPLQCFFFMLATSSCGFNGSGQTLRDNWCFVRTRQPNQSGDRFNPNIQWANGPIVTGSQGFVCHCICVLRGFNPCRFQGYLMRRMRLPHFLGYKSCGGTGTFERALIRLVEPHFSTKRWRDLFLLLIRCSEKACATEVHDLTMHCWMGCILVLCTV